MAQSPGAARSGERIASPLDAHAPSGRGSGAAPGATCCGQRHGITAPQGGVSAARGTLTSPSTARLEIRPGRPLTGEFRPPGDKSVTHRAMLLGLLARGTSRIVNANPGRDGLATLAACEALGARVVRASDAIEIEGRDFALGEPEHVLDCGNSGTTLRLLAGVLASQPFVSVLQGDASLNHRPVARVIDPLQKMGASLWARGGDAYPPLAIRGGRLRGIDYVLPVASAQVSSCILLAGLAAEGDTIVTIPGDARDHTERMLHALGVPLVVEVDGNGGRRVLLKGPARFDGASFRVPGDFSAAAFFLAAAAATPDSRVTAAGVSLNPTRTGLLEVLERMGARVTRDNLRVEFGEDVGDVTVEGPARLEPFSIPPAWVPRLIDEVPAWMIAAASARGRSRLAGAGELRIKESDRLSAICANLAALGVQVAETDDGFEIEGGAPAGGPVDAQGDHRIAMAFAVLGARARGPVEVRGAEGIGTSYPASRAHSSRSAAT
jgi:3-phosphoshikimate 1-carboxyvinyltransferase